MILAHSVFKLDNDFVILADEVTIFVEDQWYGNTNCSLSPAFLSQKKDQYPDCKWIIESFQINEPLGFGGTYWSHKEENDPTDTTINVGTKSLG